MIKKEDEIKFKITKNYDLKPKVFGIFESRSFSFSLLIIFLIYKIMDLLKFRLMLKIQILLIIAIPSFMISASSMTQDNPIYVLKYLIYYLLSKKVYLYEKDENGLKKSLKE